MGMGLVIAVAIILLALRLPSFMTRLGMSKADKILFVVIIFSLMGVAWATGRGFGVFI